MVAQWGDRLLGSSRRSALLQERRSCPGSVRVAFAVMFLELGSHRYDVTHRAVVIGCVSHPMEAMHANDWRQVMVIRLSRAADMVAGGVDVLDVGAAPAGGAEVVTEADEQERMAGLVAAMRARFDVPLSVCTTRAGVAATCLGAGAGVVDDHSGFSEPGLLTACVASGASVVASRGTPALAAATNDLSPVDTVDGVSDQLEASARLAIDAGVPAERVMVDPTVGEPARSMLPATTWKVLGRLTDAGLRVVVSASDASHEWGSSRERSHDTGETTDAGQSVLADGSDVGTLALALARGCRIIRTCDVRVARRVSGTMAAVLAHR